MRKKIIILVLALIIFSITNISFIVSSKEPATENHNITITKETDKLTIIETLTIKGNTDGYYKNITFWIPTGSSNLSVLIDSSEPEITQNGNLIVCNISALNISINKSVQALINYNLKIDTSIFQKTLQHKTNNILVTFEGKQIYTANDLPQNASFSIKLPEKEIIIKQGDNAIYTYVIVVLIIFILILLYLSMKKPTAQKPSKSRTRIGDSEELLTTKKALLMEVLKDIEKKHRAKQISDDTYHKLRDQYKQEAVETMKQLEDKKSKIK